LRKFSNEDTHFQCIQITNEMDTVLEEKSKNKSPNQPPQKKHKENIKKDILITKSPLISSHQEFLGWG